jgi:hypothetical protein
MLTFGQTLRLFREKRRHAQDDKRLSQADLYERARRIENPPDKARKGVGFPVSKHSASKQAEKIRKFEEGVRRPTEHQIKLLALALAVPRSYLDKSYPDERAIEDSITNLPPIPTSIPDGTILLQTTQEPSRSLEISVPIDHVDGIKRRRVAAVNSRNKIVIDQINSFLLADSRQAFRLCCVSGPSGSGKTYLLADWYSVLEDRPDRPRIIVIDADGKPFSEVLQAIFERVCNTRTETLNEALAEKLRSFGPAIVVVDGISVEDNPLSGEDSGSQLYHVEQLRELIKWTDSLAPTLSILLCIQSDAGSRDPLDLERDLSPTSKYLGVLAERLSTEQAVEMALTFEVSRVSDAELRAICRRTDGLPITIEVICSYIKSCDEYELDEFMVSDVPADFRHEGFTKFFRSYLTKADMKSHGRGSHPVAIMRLFALMPGPIPIAWLDLLSQELDIGRIRSSLGSELGKTAVPFLIRRDNFIDIHALARAELNRDMNDVISGGRKNRFVNLGEVQSIHLAMANVCRRLLAQKTRIRKFDAHAIEHLVYHLIRYRDLVLEYGQHCELLTKAFAQGGGGSGIYSGEASPKEITDYCWHEIIMKFVVDRSHTFTRNLGQFERKANILSHLLPGRDINRTPEFLAAVQSGELLKEISICYSHLGRLNMALAAVNSAVTHVPSVRIAEELDPVNDWERWYALPSSDRELWLTNFEGVTHKCLVEWRRGQHYRGIDRTLQQYRQFFDRVSAFEVDPTNHDQRRLTRACRRFIARDAHMQLYRGEFELALSRFEAAAKIDHAAGRAQLTGDAARRHIQTLIRVFGDHEDCYGRITDILNFNLEYLTKQEKWHQSQTTDQVSWFCCQSAVFRFAGDFDGSEVAMRRARDHPMLSSGQIPYYARAEIFMEECRLGIASGKPIADTIFNAQIEEYARRHHKILAYETVLIWAESSDSAEVKEWLAVAEIEFEATEWLMRLADVSLLKMGQSACKAFVF